MRLPACLPALPTALQVEEIHLSFTVLNNSSNARVWCVLPALPHCAGPASHLGRSACPAGSKWARSARPA